MIERIRQLIDELNYYTKLYDEGTPEISDANWDKMYFELSELEQKTGLIYPDSPTQTIQYEIQSSLAKVTHNHPMLSLGKTKSIDDVHSFGIGHTLTGMAKMDGLTCSLHYIDGVLQRGETRGDGTVGSDITPNARVIPSIPQSIPIKDEIVVDGEIICTYDDFENFSNTYSNPRNFAAGSIQLLDAKECSNRHLTFVAWDFIKGAKTALFHTRLIELENLGFTVVPHLTGIDLDKMVESLREWATAMSYPIDGLVFKWDNCEEYTRAGLTAHHPNGALAYKFYDEEYDTILRSIEFSMGKSGVLTPVAVFDAVDDSVSVITRASLHNLSIMEQLLGKIPYNGQRITVAKMNQIIPQVVAAEANNEGETCIPAVCPYCGTPTEIITSDSGVRQLVCPNAKCEGKFINILDHFCGKSGLDIKGLSIATLEKLIDWGWVYNIASIFDLEQYRLEWSRKPGFGIKSVDNILDAIESAKDCELSAFISAIGIPLIGVTYAKQIAKNCLTWENFCDKIDKKFDFSSWDGFGEEMCASLLKFDYSEARRIAEWMRFKEPQAETKNDLTGLNFVITGSLHSYPNRDALKNEIEQHGGKVISAISKKTTYLINNNINSSSTKNTRAKELGIPIITEEEFIEKFF